MGKHVMITGAGFRVRERARALALAETGHDVIATTETEEQADALRAEAPQLTVEKLDITIRRRRQGARAGTSTCSSTTPGPARPGRWPTCRSTRVRRLFEVNVFGTLAVTQAVLPQMVAEGAGRVIIVSSIAGVVVGARRSGRTR